MQVSLAVIISMHRRSRVDRTAHALAGREFMRLHPQEVFLTIHDDPNPISTIVSGATTPPPPVCSPALCGCCLRCRHSLHLFLNRVSSFRMRRPFLQRTPTVSPNLFIGDAIRV